MSAHKQIDAGSAYADDFYAWTTDQAALLRDGRLSDLDRHNLAEEIEALGRSVKREVVSRFAVLLLQLLKWSFQPERQGNGWRLTIVEQREQILGLVRDNPSLRPYRDEAVKIAYQAALTRAERETGLLRDMFPWACPYTPDQILDDAFWPEPATS